MEGPARAVLRSLRRCWETMKPTASRIFFSDRATSNVLGQRQCELKDLDAARIADHLMERTSVPGAGDCGYAQVA